MKNDLKKGHILRSKNYEYEIEKVLGHGGFGITYLATTSVRVGNVTLTAKFAIKEHFISDDCWREEGSSHVIYSVPAKDRVENSRKDFISEAQRLQNVGVKHNNIVKVNEIFEENDTAYYVMEYLEGESLRDYVSSRGSLSEEEMYALITPIADAVGWLHENKMTHLDIKPENIMLVKEKDGEIRPVLIDFGLSKHYGKDDSPTSTMRTMGCSDGFSPMEQYMGITSFSPESDIYALGATMYYCLTGENPQKASDLRDGDIANGVKGKVSAETEERMRKATRLLRADRVRDIRELFGLKGRRVASKTLSETKLNKGVETKITNVDKQNPIKTEVTTKTEFITGNQGEVTTSNDGNKNRKMKLWLLGGLGLLVAGFCLGMFIVMGGASDKIDNEDEGDRVAKEKSVKRDSAKIYQEIMDAYQAQEYTKCVELAMEIPNNGEVQSLLGKLYYNGLGVERDIDKAIEWGTKAAEQGEMNSQYALASIYYTGDEVERNVKEAVKWFSALGEEGDVTSQLMLGNIYSTGDGIGKDYAKAAEWYKKAAEEGNAEAQYQLGNLYYTGKLPLNHPEALKWFRMAAEQGHMEAEFMVGEMHYSGEGGAEQDYDTVVYWLERAAKQGHKQAKAYLDAGIGWG